MKTQKIVALAIVLLLAISIPFSAINGVKAAPTGSISLSAPPSNLAIGSTFTVTANIASSTDVWQWVINNLSWDPSVIHIVGDPVEGNFLKAGGGTLFVGNVPDNTNTNGILPQVSCTRMSTTTASGSGDLATFTFQVVGYGSTAISIGSAELQDSSQVVVTVSSSGATYTGLPPPPPYGPTAVITGITDGAFILQGSTINVIGSTSTAGFDGSTQKPITEYSWVITNPAGSFSGATGSFIATTAGDTTISLTVTATGAVPETNTKTITIHVYAPPSGAAIDVYTLRGGQGPNATSDAYGPQQNINITASITYNNVPVVGQDVSFEIHDKSGAVVATRIARTDATGIATTSYRLPWPDVNPDGTFGTWMIVATVAVSEVVVNDTCSFAFDYLLKTTTIATLTVANAPATSFARDAQMKVSVTVQNIAQASYSGLVCVTIFDEANVPVATVKVDLTVPGGSSATAVQTITIPHYTFVGQAIAYVDILTQLPSLGGVPYSPEQSQGLTITAS